LRGAAHSKCNLQYRRHKFISIIFHGMSNYDSYLFIEKLQDKNINVIAKTEEKYIAFNVELDLDTFEKDGQTINVTKELRFLDSFKFMASRLDSLSKNLDKDQHTHLQKHYQGRQLELLLRKGVYPYDYVNCIDKLSERSLPPKHKFYSRLNEEDVTDDDYKHAETVWKEFGMFSLRDYLELYNVTDVSLLADVFKNFRDVCVEHYKLDPHTAPGLSWDAMMKTTKIKLELLSDVDMLRMVQQGIRGGMTVPKRYAEANNKYVGDKYDASQPSKYILYLDANALYSWAMTNPLPTGGFEWMAETELNNWRNIPCILETDLDYPEDLHDLHNEYPLAPENIKVGDNKIEKLVANLRPKENYVIHSETLKLYESLGLKIT